MEKLIYVLVLFYLISCGNPVDSDKNIVKDKIKSKDVFARPTAINSLWTYRIDAVYTENGLNKLPVNYPVNIQENVLSKNDVKGENWFISTINGNDVNVQVGEDFIYYEVDEFEKLILPISTYTDLYIKVNSEEDWTYNGIDYTYLGNSNIDINGTIYNVKSVKFENKAVNQTGATYTKTVYYNSDLGIVKIEYLYNFTTRLTIFNLKLDLLSFKQ